MKFPFTFRTWSWRYDIAY